MDLSQDQLAALNKLRSQVSDILSKEQLENDRFLLRWLKARDYSVPKAETMLRNSMNWRKKEDVDNILTNYQPHEVLKKHYPGGILGFNKKNNLVWLIPISGFDPKGIHKTVKRSDMFTYAIWLFETASKAMEENNRKHGLNAEQIYLIMDLEGMSLKQVTNKPQIEYMQEFSKIMEQNYPERMEKLVVINANKLYNIVWPLLRPLLNDATYAKVKIFSNNDQSWKDLFLADMDADILPVHWGGTRTDSDGDPKCSSVILPGGDVPKELYSTPDKVLSELEGLQTVVVNAGGTALIEAEIEQPRSILRWVFGTDGHDIAFGVYHKTAQGLEEHIPKERVSCHLVPEDGELECIETGTYVFAFDNSHSVVRNKTVKFRIEVVPAEEK